MKKRLRNKLTVSLATLVYILLLAACATKESAHVHDTYTCPMHPTVVSEKPGACPVCGMDLVRKARPGEEVAISEELRALAKSPNEVVMSTVKTIRGEYKSMRLQSSAQGVVTYDPRKVYTLSSRIAGRLEKVFVKYAFQPVRKGQKVAEIYSPDLVTAQRELLYIVKNDPQNGSLITAAKNKMLAMGVSTDQLNTILRQQAAQYSFAIFSPYNGYVLAADQQPPAATPSMTTTGSNMEGTASTTTVAGSSASDVVNEVIREGDYVAAGQSLFTIADAQAFRIELSLPQAEARALSKASTVYIDNDTLTTSVDFVQPFLSYGEEFLKVWIYAPREKALKIGQVVTAHVELDDLESLWIPAEAVVDLGLDQVVFVKQRDTFKARKIVAGKKINGWVEVTRGLTTTDEIAGNAQYLVDSESFIKAE